MLTQKEKKNNSKQSEKGETFAPSFTDDNLHEKNQNNQQTLRTKGKSQQLYHIQDQNVKSNNVLLYLN